MSYSIVVIISSIFRAIYQSVVGAVDLRGGLYVYSSMGQQFFTACLVVFVAIVAVNQIPQIAASATFNNFLLTAQRVTHSLGLFLQLSMCSLRKVHCLNKTKKYVFRQLTVLFLLCDATQNMGIAMASRPSVCPSICDVDYHGHLGWNALNNNFIATSVFTLCRYQYRAFTPTV